MKMFKGICLMLTVIFCAQISVLSATVKPEPDCKNLTFKTHNDKAKMTNGRLFSVRVGEEKKNTQQWSQVYVPNPKFKKSASRSRTLKICADKSDMIYVRACNIAGGLPNTNKKDAVNQSEINVYCRNENMSPEAGRGEKITQQALFADTTGFEFDLVKEKVEHHIKPHGTYFYSKQRRGILKSLP